MYDDLRALSVADARLSVWAADTMRSLETNVEDSVPGVLASHRMDDESEGQMGRDGCSGLTDGSASVGAGLNNSSSSISSGVQVFGSQNTLRDSFLEPDPPSITAHVPARRTRKRLGDEHRRGMVRLGSLINAAPSSSATDHQTQNGSEVGEDGEVQHSSSPAPASDWSEFRSYDAEDATSDNSHNAEDETESDEEVLRNRTAALHQLEGLGGDDEDEPDEEVLRRRAEAYAKLVGEPAPQSDDAEFLHRLEGFPYDLPSGPTSDNSRCNPDGETAEDKFGCGLFRPAFTRLHSRVDRIRHPPREIPTPRHCPAPTNTAPPAALPRHCHTQSRLEYLFATQPIYDVHGSRITEPGSTGAAETVGEKVERVLRDLEADVLVVGGGSGPQDTVVGLLEDLAEKMQ